MTSFATLPLSEAFLANLDSLGYREMTDIQAQSLPAVMQGRDLIAQAKTGSGKTAAFGIGMLCSLNTAWFAVQGLVLCPTRELADQVAGELRRLARCVPNVKIVVLTGGTPMRPQIASLEFGAHIIVGTPGRVRDHLSRETLDLSTVRTLVLDEADRMTDMGFYDEIAGIVKACPKRRQTLLFSATYPDDMRQATEAFLADPLEITVEAQHSSSKIEQRFYEIGFDERDRAVGKLLRVYQPASAIIFCNTKVHCKELLDELRAEGFSALALYGELEQRERDEVLVLFANRSCSILIATDVAARGLDIANLEAVINADVSRDTEVHIHRIGRTGRGGEKGLSLTLCAPNEKKWVKLIEEYQNAPVEWHDLKALGDDEYANAEPAPMLTLCISGGKKEKLRAGDVLGALCGDGGLVKEQVGKIAVTEFQTYVALDRRIAHAAFDRLKAASTMKGGDFGSFKGRNFKMRFIEV
ncbi:ATP-dependent RNA helicase DbpA [Pseudoduganella sp. DS3]|uniref:ATP-dependent RNA helicase DbpA n=1 Tax=Pseudoduganella guangdongensis TaxID=2692179 RepID=A0A6N9HJ34_9BURK|nr:ATP-dependent RNA helicase DbpA [Pseudoduganella guangdongensis]MYN03133.1 ATP-dependent RNA helicase DbpA [Pseudoduganella guangdongensis]